MKSGGGDARPEVWWRDGLYFSCAQCGACCGREPGTVSFTRLELEAMSRALGISNDEFLRLYTWEKYETLSLREQSNYDCVFLHMDKNNISCKIYSARPAQCGTFPFWPDTLKNKLSWDDYSLSCPGMNCGEFHSYEEISQIITRYIYDGVSKFL
ncbi:MAG: YkgJ family cysteine cluster protein [Synergistaceae bacterium]|jgi:Fe-S-cluster containining protein|nr:YkgJ family cysteine cluster protein [Synergistaceae bacterium]